MTHSSSPLAYMRDQITSLDALLNETLPHLHSSQELIDLGDRILRLCEKVASHLQNIRPTPPLACCEGCGTCCHNRIEVNPLWAFVTLAAAQKSLPEEKQQIVKERLKNDAAFCPFHFDGACSIYESRPPVCRGYYSRDLRRCIDGDYCEGLEGYQGEDAHAAHQNMIFLFVLEERLKSLEEALQLEAGPVFLDDAVAAVLDTPDSAQRWLQGNTLFSQYLANRSQREAH